MRQRVKDIVECGDQHFADKGPILSLWQACAEQFHVMRADFTRARFLSEEFGSFLMTGRPARCHRDLTNAFSTMLRPRDQQWFHARTDAERVNQDRNAKLWLDWASKTERMAMYDRRASFVRATKEADGDFVLTGNAILTRDLCDYDHWLFQCWHPRDVAWAENYKGSIDQVHFNWRPRARDLVSRFGKTKLGVSQRVANLVGKEAYKEIRCRRMVIAADQYDLSASETRGMPWVSVIVDVENEHIMEEVPQRTRRVHIPRWAAGGTVYGRQYFYSPAVIYALPDARMLQQVMLSLFEASEMANRPPMLAVGEAINGAVNLYAAGITQVDADYDERTGAVLRAVEQHVEGIRFAAEQREQLHSGLDDAFFLNKIRFPEITKEMTAYEASKLWDEFIRSSLPLFEPVEVDYNASICEDLFEDMMALGRFGPVSDMPQVLRGRDVSFQFDTPITVAADRALTGAFQAMVGTIVQGAQVDPSVNLLPDMVTAARDAIDGTGAPAKWLRSEEQFAEVNKQAQQKQQAAEAAAALARGADTASRLGDAARNAGDAASALQNAGVM